MDVNNCILHTTYFILQSSSDLAMDMGTITPSFIFAFTFLCFVFPKGVTEFQLRSIPYQWGYGVTFFSFLLVASQVFVCCNLFCYHLRQVERGYA